MTFSFTGCEASEAICVKPMEQQDFFFRKLFDKVVGHTFGERHAFGIIYITIYIRCLEDRTRCKTKYRISETNPNIKKTLSHVQALLLH